MGPIGQLLEPTGSLSFEEAYDILKKKLLQEEMQELIRVKEGNRISDCLSEGNGAVSGKRYGRQMSGGYSIQVKELSASSNAVFLKQN